MRSSWPPDLLFKASSVLLISLAAGACRREAHAPRQPPKPVVVWRSVGSWSGAGSKQTESFRSESGTLRIRWTLTAPPGAKNDPGPFRLTAHSAISGRLLEQVVDHRGPGEGVGYVNQDPHVFYLMVESERVDWKIAVDEGFTASAQQK